MRASLLECQRRLHASGVSTLIILAGPEGGGKGDLVNRLNLWFDTRGVETHAFWADSDEERERPRLWRFWRRLPPRGFIAIMFGAWYWQPLYRRVRREISGSEFEREALRIAALERMLQQDGMLIVKLWLHLDDETRERRMRKRREIQRHVRGPAAEGEGARQYQAYIDAAERMLQITGAASTPWHLIDAGNPWHRDIVAGRAVLEAMERRLAAVSDSEAPSPVAPPADRDRLGRVDLTQTLDRTSYERELKQLQKRLSSLAWQAHDARRPTVIVFEGWDAAGKGGIIRRLVTAMDPRLYQVVPVGAPNDVERARHYLWRFWRRLPRAGFMTVYDRSWYGRVLVERVEGIAGPGEWQRAYEEINDFEAQLLGYGAVLAKFWLHISPDEQLRRFRERERVSWKQYKITAEDWRNRGQRAAYIEAIEDMLLHTDTRAAPWTLVAAEDKRQARISVLKHTCKLLETALGH